MYYHCIDHSWTTHFININVFFQTGVVINHAVFHVTKYLQFIHGHIYLQEGAYIIWLATSPHIYI